jgi:hypothetical protein
MTTVSAKLEDAVTGQVPSIQSPCAQSGRNFVYLAYLDDSEQRDWQVIGAVLIPADSFFVVELLSALEIENLMPKERLHEFQEFHASELYCGSKGSVFEGIDQQKRYNAIANLLQCIATCGGKVAYGSVDTNQLRKGSYFSANARDVAFRRCVLGVEEWMSKSAIARMAELSESGSQFSTLFIMDETAQGDKATQLLLQRSFRSLRPCFRVSGPDNTRLTFVHDDMYFGDSRYSIGIQIADLCSYFIAKHLCGHVDSEGFYKMIEPHIVNTGKEES